MKNLKSKRNVRVFLCLIFLFTVFSVEAIEIDVQIRGKGGIVNENGVTRICPESSSAVCATAVVKINEVFQVCDRTFALNSYTTKSRVSWANLQGLLYIEEQESISKWK
jgi:hypothetical protein